MKSARTGEIIINENKTKPPKPASWDKKQNSLSHYEEEKQIQRGCQFAFSHGFYRKNFVYIHSKKGNIPIVLHSKMEKIFG